MKIRFSISNLLLFTVIVSLCLGWWLDHQRMEKRIAVFDRMKIGNSFLGVAFALDDDAFYRVTYSTNYAGGGAEAFRLSDGQLIWKTNLNALGTDQNLHSSNQISVGLDAEGLVIKGTESFGTYWEIRDLKTGAMVRNTVNRRDFSKREDYKQK